MLPSPPDLGTGSIRMREFFFFSLAGPSFLCQYAPLTSPWEKRPLHVSCGTLTLAFVVFLCRTSYCHLVVVFVKDCPVKDYHFWCEEQGSLALLPAAWFYVFTFPSWELTDGSTWWGTDCGRCLVPAATYLETSRPACLGAHQAFNAKGSLHAVFWAGQLCCHLWVL